MRVRVKICGLASPEAVDAAVEHGADAVGFVFSPSPRQVTIEQAVALSRRVPSFVARVAVFADPAPEDVRWVVDAFDPDAVEAHEHSVRALRPLVGERWLPVFHDGPGVLDRIQRFLDEGPKPSGVVLDGVRSGAGIAADWRVAARAARLAPLVLAGGLDPGNVGEAIRTVRPFAVDVSSGVESSPAQKDPARIAAFIAAVRSAEAEP